MSKTWSRVISILQVQVREILPAADVSEMTEDEQLAYAMKLSFQPSTAKDDLTVLDKQYKETVGFVAFLHFLVGV